MNGIQRQILDRRKDEIARELKEQEGRLRRIEYNEAVVEYGNETDGIFFRDLEPVKVVSVMHKGSYDDLPKAYAYLADWVEKNGYNVTANCRESYIDGIWNKSDESEWLTEIQFPIG